MSLGTASCPRSKPNGSAMQRSLKKSLSQLHSQPEPPSVDSGRQPPPEKRTQNSKKTTLHDDAYEKRFPGLPLGFGLKIQIGRQCLFNIFAAAALYLVGA